MRHPLFAPTLIAAVTLPVLLSLGRWQLQRHAERNAGREEALAALALPPLTEIPDAPPLWRRVEVAGAWVPPRRLLAGRSDGGRPGYGLFQAFLPAGAASPVLVDRGFVPHDGLDAVLAQLVDEPVSQVAGQARPLTGDAAATPITARAVGLPLYPPASVAAIARDVGASWQVVAGPALEPGQEPPPGLPVAGYVAVPDDTTSRNYAIQWFTAAGAVFLMWLGAVARHLRAPKRVE